MIDEDRTLSIYGYTSKDLSSQSAKRIIVMCDECGKVRDVRMNSYRDLCPACAQRGRTLTEDHRHKISKSVSAYANAKSWYTRAHRNGYWCRVCGKRLVENENWCKSNVKSGNYICKQCSVAYSSEYNHKQGIYQPMGKNRACSLFLGVCVAEKLLSKVFVDVKRMPNGTVGYDLICNRGKRIDVKSACTRFGKRRSGRWLFSILKNTIADYFLCVAFDDREQLNPLHLWLIPGTRINHLQSTSISINRLSKWDEYKLDIKDVVHCCEAMR